ncbi:hypothetical protein CC86DRAFT_281256 [Ophiobolus disseminans]|uniref:ARB-07466-like C-terminal domain-containing protein n=1 Tax=Ophiobolus disseminans TaxID=1469910 RepID=A0A6A7AGJ5_9PLEO|nr:hypothetical protein CC86DRAFT_281256 [Ophiobolus disseminans]
MQLTSSLILVALFSLQGINAALNEPCYGANGVAGVCVKTSTCASEGGTTTDNACPSDPSDVKCCSKPKCGASPGNCRWTSDCAGSSVANQCPGPGAFKCCQSAAQGFGGYDKPSPPTTAQQCKQVAIDGAKWVVGQFDGRIKSTGCYRPNCDCEKSDHCCGKAIDFMCSDSGGAATSSGREIAEWVMNNRAGHDVKYIIWGQRIWQSGNNVEPWTGWKPMEDRKSITANHWDHVHVSFN